MAIAAVWVRVPLRARRSDLIIFFRDGQVALLVFLPIILLYEYLPYMKYLMKKLAVAVLAVTALGTAHGASPETPNYDNNRYPLVQKPYM